MMEIMNLNGFRMIEGFFVHLGATFKNCQGGLIDGWSDQIHFFSAFIDIFH